jgi:hypothetical protein
LPKVYRNSLLQHRLQAPRDWLVTVRRRPPLMRFVLFSQGRTGSSLLESLLAAHPRVHRSTEILSKRRRLGHLYLFLDAESRRTSLPVFGAKVKIEQLDFQGVEPRRFLSLLVERDWRIIHLWRRDTLRQAVSHFVRRHRGESHRKVDLEEELRLRIEPAKLIEQIEIRQERLRRELVAVEDLPHAEVIYEDDLLRAERHQPTADRLFELLGVSSVPVSTRFRKVTPEDLPSLIENWTQVRDALAGTAHAHWLASVSGSPLSVSEA